MTSEGVAMTSEGVAMTSEGCCNDKRRVLQ
jgi:hypothetical protein